MWYDNFGLRPERPFTGVSGPSGPEIPKKSQKEFFWGSAKKSPKIPEKVEKYPKLDFFGYFSTFSGIFGDLFADPQKNSFWDFFGISGPEGPETPVNGRSGRKFWHFLTNFWPEKEKITSRDGCFLPMNVLFRLFRFLGNSTILFKIMTFKLKNNYWAAANGGVTNGGLRGVWPPVLEIWAEIGLFRSVLLPFSSPFPEGPEEHLENPAKRSEKSLFRLRYPGRFARHPLNPHLLNPHLRHSKIKSCNCSRRKFLRVPEGH